jgi:hypothetical protein
MDNNFVGGVTFDDQLFKLYCPGYIIPYIFHLLNKFILATVFSEDYISRTSAYKIFNQIVT